MRRRDVLSTLIAVGLSRSLDELTLKVVPEPTLGKPSRAAGPTEFGTVDVHLVLSDLFPEANLVEDDDYFGLQTELLFLRFHRVSDIRQYLLRNKPYALEVDAAAVQAVKTGAAKEPLWLTEGMRRRATERGVFLSHVGLARTALIKEFGSQYQLCDTAALVRHTESA